MFFIFLAVFIFINKRTKGRYGEKEYLIIITIISIFQILISYKSEFIYLTFIYIALQPFILLSLFCVNIYISTKRVNDAVISEIDKYFVYLSPVSNLILYMICLLTGFIFIESKPIYLVLLILFNIMPIVNLYSKEYDINIKNTDIPIDYRRMFNKIYTDLFLFEIKDNYIFVNDFRFSVKHNTNTYTITSYKDVENDNLLIKYLSEKGIRRLCFHYMYFYYELTDEEYNTMIADIKAMKNVIYIDYPYIAVNNKKIYIRNDGLKYSVLLQKGAQEEQIYATYLLNNISKRIENEEYICYKEIKKNDIIEWIKSIPKTNGWKQ
jgi:uncharacterized membrane protein YhaH (DUF805 family)